MCLIHDPPQARPALALLASRVGSLGDSGFELARVGGAAPGARGLRYPLPLARAGPARRDAQGRTPLDDPMCRAVEA